jgi:hypothetical protein
VDTGRLSTYSEKVATDPALIRIRDKVELDFQSGIPNTFAEVELLLTNGSRISARHDSGVPAEDTAAQGKRLEEKFNALVDPVLGTEKATALIAAIGSFDTLPDIRGVLAMCAG